MKNINKSNVTIVDISYVNINTIKYIFNKFDYNGKIIYIGSFDKMIGCGLRCGFALFPTKYINDIQLQRE
jgi:DNA-binding transcriptional MocR family regulator